jgi:ATP-dependent protease ClpP protease subunit
MAEIHVNIFGEIGWENNLQSVSAQTKSATKDDYIVLHIHSPGGEVNEGFAIYDHLVGLGIDGETRIEGHCASIATVPAMAYKKRTITENSNFFVHNPWTMAEGDASALIDTAEQLKAIENRIATFYSRVTGKSVDDMLALMAIANEIKPTQAKELGFVTDIIKPVMAMASLKSNNQINQITTETIMDFLAKMKSDMNNLFKGVKNQLPENAVLNSITATLTDGNEIEIITDSDMPAVGDAVVMVASGEAAPNGDHTLEGGTIVSTSEGIITAIVEAVVEAEDLQVENSALKSELESVKAELLETQNLFTEFKNKLEGKQMVYNRTQRTSFSDKNVKTANRLSGLNLLDKTKYQIKK